MSNILFYMYILIESNLKWIINVLNKTYEIDLMCMLWAAYLVLEKD